MNCCLYLGLPSFSTKRYEQWLNFFNLQMTLKFHPIIFISIFRRVVIVHQRIFLQDILINFSLSPYSRASNPILVFSHLHNSNLYLTDRDECSPLR